MNASTHYVQPGSVPFYGFPQYTVTATHAPYMVWYDTSGRVIHPTRLKKDRLLPSKTSFRLATDRLCEPIANQTWISDTDRKRADGLRNIGQAVTIWAAMAAGRAMGGSR